MSDDDVQIKLAKLRYGVVTAEDKAEQRRAAEEARAARAKAKAEREAQLAQHREERAKAKAEAAQRRAEKVNSKGVWHGNQTGRAEGLQEAAAGAAQAPRAVDEGLHQGDAGDEPPAQPAAPGRKPRAPRRVSKSPETLDEKPVLRVANPELQAALQEALDMPYEAPSFHFNTGESPEAELAARELARRRLLPFIQRFRPKYMAGWVHADICRRIERFVEQVEQGKSPRLLLMMPPRSGKLLSDDTLVPTPSGWVRHGQLGVGDEVFHPSGKVLRVVATSPKDVADVRVTFSDGATYLCHENHEWTLFDRKRGAWVTREAGYFIGDGAPKLHTGNRAIYQLPVVGALEYRESEFTLHPYVLGAWLGDGSAGKPCITGAASDAAIIDKIVSLGYPVSTVCTHKTTGVLTTYFSGPRPGVAGKLTRELQELGIYKNKRIPEQYQRMSVELRLELLAGLIDTDGSTDKNSRVMITTVSRELAYDIKQLCEGLGLRPYVQEVQPKLSSSGIQGRKVCYVVGFQPTQYIPVALPRKRVTRFAKQRRVGLVSVERVPPEQAARGHCIQVDSPDGLYVVGEQLTTTHNSEISSRHTPAWILGKHPEWEIIAGSHTSSLALSFSRYLRDLMRNPAYQVVFPESRLDPNSQALENWNTTKGGGYLAAGVGTGITGRGCLAPYTLVDTSRGKMRIVDLKVGDSVYGYDHERKKVVETCVKAVQVTERSKPLVDCGSIRLTTDHRIYNAARGFYTSAGESSRLLGLWRKEGSSRGDVQSVLFESADGYDHIAKLRLLWEELQAQRGGVSEVEGSPRGGGASVLLAPVLRHLQAPQPDRLQQGEGGVRALQEAGDGNRQVEILQHGVLQRLQGVEAPDGCVQWRVSDTEVSGAGAGQGLPAVRSDSREVRDASYQRGHNSERGWESGDALRSVPPQVSSVHGVCAADIAEVFAPFDFVVDIQTGSGNFFTEGLLVHNCNVLLLDDLVKDMEAADSETIREGTWEWYLSTAYTRLAPGGGVLGLMCMTGDTPVMMVDGSYRRLDSLRAGDAIATYAAGLLAGTRVAAMRSSGHDSVYKITTTSGKIVRANQRHPFLTVAPSGEVSWTRLKNLTTGHKIVTVKESGGSGKGSCVLPRDASVLRNVAASAIATTQKSVGQMGIAQTPTPLNRAETRASNIATGSLQLTTTLCTTLSKVAALFAENMRKLRTLLRIGKQSSPSIIATTPAKSADCCVTIATQGSDILKMSPWHCPPQGISDFTLSEISAIEPDGFEEVFDVQVNCTENFIANGLVSHNTWWHEMDWAGRIQEAMRDGEGDQFEVIRYPAINDQGDEYILADDAIVQIAPGMPVPQHARMTRPMNTAVHPARYTTEAMLKIKRNLIGGGMKRVWDALYQQNPLPDEGIEFTKQMFRYYGTRPDVRDLRIYQAWDFAISEGKESDYTVGACIGVDHRDNVYVLDLKRFKSGDGAFIIDEVLDFAQEWGVHDIGVEDGQIWKSLKFQFEKRCSEKRFYPSFEQLVPLTDKKVRASPLKGRMQLGKVYFDKLAHYFTDMQKELLTFPNGKHDDIVDALAWAIRLTLARAAPRRRDTQPKTKSWKDKLNALIGGGGGSHMAS